MAKSSIMQRSNQNKKVHFTKTMWDYLRYRLESQVEVLAKNGVSTILHVRKNGTKEVIKCRIVKESIRLDTSSLFEHLQRVLGRTIALGLRQRNPAAPKLRARETLTFNSLRPSNEDTFNLFFPLPNQTLDGTTHRPRNPGVDFKYDPIKRELRVAFRFRRAAPHDPVVLALVGDLPATSNDESSDESHDHERLVNDDLVIEEGDHLGNDDFLLTVRRVLSNSTHVVVDVVESQDFNFTVGSERILTMATARDLYRQYNDM
jgi:hypothetical protein